VYDPVLELVSWSESGAGCLSALGLESVPVWRLGPYAVVWGNVRRFWGLCVHVSEEQGQGFVREAGGWGSFAGEEGPVQLREESPVQVRESAAQRRVSLQGGPCSGPIANGLGPSPGSWLGS